MATATRQRVAIVTGGGSGIGAASARRLAADGWLVVVSDIDGLAAEAVANDVTAQGGNAYALECDVSDAESTSAMADAVMSRHQSIAALFNAGGILIGGTAIEIGPLEWQKTIDVNLTGTFNACRSVIPHMVESGGGSIINTSSSTGAHDAIGGLVGYVASKGGVTLLTKSLAIDHIGVGVRVNAIAPGPTDTPMLRRAFPTEEERQAFGETLPIRRLGHPDEIAAVVAFLASDEASFVNGAIIAVDGGQTAHV